VSEWEYEREYAIDGETVRLVSRRTPEGERFDAVDTNGDVIVGDFPCVPELDDLCRLIDEARSSALSIDDLAAEREYD
jgi:hypothetical protein